MEKEPSCKNIFAIAFILLFSFCSCNTPQEKEKSTEKQEAPKLFTLVSPSVTGVNFINKMVDNDEVMMTYEYRFNGCGVGVGDINNDGLPDLFFTAGNLDNKLYLNKGNMQFEDISEKAMIFKREAVSTGVCMADVNADGWLDIYVCRTGKFPPEQRANLLYINNGNQTFTERAKEYGLDDKSYSNQVAFFDCDNDGDLDMFLVNQPIDYTNANTLLLKADTQKTFVSDRLYRNNGNGTYTDVTIKAGVSSSNAFGFDVAVEDFNNDGYWDLYVTNDYLQPDYLYINNGNGTFTESLKKYMKHCPNSSMGSCIADYNNDGLPDVMIVDMMAEDNHRQKILKGSLGYDDFNIAKNNGGYYQYMRNQLQLNNGNGTFSEIGEMAGVSNTDWSWGPLFADLDNDGWKDLFIANGYRRDLTNLDFIHYYLDSINKMGGIGIFKHMYDLLNSLPESPVKNYALKNNRDLTFSKVSDEWGFTDLTYSNGAVYADLDNDGDLEIIINNTDQPAMIYKSNSRELSKNNYIQFKLKGDSKNTQRIGTTVKISTAEGEQVITYQPTQGFFSSVENRIYFGIGKDTIIQKAEIMWHGGFRQILENLPANQQVLVEKKNAQPFKKEKPVASEKLFADATQSSGIDFVHRENDFIDFKKEPLLPQKFSEPGPCLATGDVNGDKLKDFFIGGATGQAGALYIQKSNSTFSKQANPAFESDKMYEDAGATFFDADGDDDLDLYVASGGNEWDENSPEYQHRLYVNDGKGNFSRAKDTLPEIRTSSMCVAPNDFDKDGDMDLFVGGRIVPLKYPESPRSYILRNDKGKFTDVTEEICKELMYPGLVCNALWTDYNNDGYPDLIIAGQWMPVSVFKNENGKLKNITKGSGLDSSNGWWNYIAAGDFDHDGDMDYAVGNRGLNSRIKAKENEPACVYAKDFDNSGTLDAIMCYYIQGTSYPIHSRDMMTDQVRGLKKKFLRYRDYADATIYDVFPKAVVDSALILRAHTFASSYIENLGNGKFKITPLPLETQFSTVNSILVNDFDGDGNADLLLAGNDYSPEVETGRYDASIGIFLKSDGKGHFKNIPATLSGFFVDTYARDMKMISTQHGSLILVGNNNDRMKVIRWNKKK
ncbi:MAG TPA: VCBS repeat-containing protein [Bacteroidia bacterium]|nr:VCBS repeat-containing protein [Bacteroidia bacterium]